MKRVRDWPRYIRLQNQRARVAIERRRRSYQIRVKRRQSLLGVAHDQRLRHVQATAARKNFKIEIAPTVISLLANPDVTLDFFGRLRTRLEKRRPTWVSLRPVKRIDHDALVVLLSIMVKFREANVGFNGDNPKDARVAARLRQSGFFELLFDSSKHNAEESYRFGNENAILSNARRNVDPELTAGTVELAAEAIWGEKRRCQGVQRIFLELMQNTNNHASPARKGEKHWWASTNYRRAKKVVSFAFVDLGVGVLRSLDGKSPRSRFYNWRSKLLELYPDVSNADLMRLILDGELHQTVTGHYFRGKGLPGIKEVFDRNGISRLVIITNDVYVDVRHNVFRSLRIPFDGTFVYWELSASNTSLPLWQP